MNLRVEQRVYDDRVGMRNGKLHIRISVRFSYEAIH